MKILWSTILFSLAASGQVVGGAGSYHDDAVGLTYQFPAGFMGMPTIAKSIDEGMAAHATTAEEKLLTKCFHVPLVLMKNAAARGDEEFGMVIMFRADHACAKDDESAEWLGEETQQVTRVMAGLYGGRPLTEDATEYKLDGRPASFVQGSAEATKLGGGAMMHAATVCMQVKASTVCWAMMDTKHKMMPGIVASGVKFDGGVETPMVPKDLVRPW